MNDTLEYSVLALGLLMVLHIGLLHSVERKAYDSVHAQFGTNSIVQVLMVPAGVFGLEANHWRDITISVKNAELNNLPLSLHPHSSWRGEIDQLKLRIRHLYLSGISVDRMDAKIPAVTYDAGTAVTRGQLQLRSAGDGTASIWVGSIGLQEFIARKYARLLRSVRVRITDGHVYIAAQLNLLGSWFPFKGRFGLRVQGNRYVYLVHPVVSLNHQPATTGLSKAVAQQVNPVLDTVTDLGLQGVFRLSSLSIQGNEIQFLGSMNLPVAAVTYDRKKDK